MADILIGVFIRLKQLETTREPRRRRRRGEGGEEPYLKMEPKIQQKSPFEFSAK